MSAKQKILVVDDEEDILEILKYNLEKEGFEVKTASDGNAGIEMAEKFDPHLIILDIIMPKKSGIEALSAIKDKFPDVTVVMISINEGQSYRKLAEVYRVDKYIGKNSDDIHKELLEVIQATQQKLAAKNS